MARIRCVVPSQSAFNAGGRSETQILHDTAIVGDVVVGESAMLMTGKPHLALVVSWPGGGSLVIRKEWLDALWGDVVFDETGQRPAVDRKG